MATGEARHTKQTTAAQKDAIRRSVFTHGRTVSETIRMANAGELDIPAFKAGHYAYQIVRDGRELYEQTDDDALAAAVEKELRGAENDALATLRAIRRAFKRDGSGDTDTLRKAVADLAAIRKARRDTGFKPGPKPTMNTSEDANGHAKPNADVLGGLLKGTSGSARSGSLARSRTASAA